MFKVRYYFNFFSTIFSFFFFWYLARMYWNLLHRSKFYCGHIQIFRIIIIHTISEFNSLVWNYGYNLFLKKKYNSKCQANFFFFK